MISLYILIGISLIGAGVVLAVFLWAGKKGQFDDTEGPKYRMLDDE